MIDAKRLIDQLLGAGGSGNLQKTIGNVLSELGQGGSGKGGGAGGDLIAQGRDYLTRNGGSLAGGALAGGLLSMVLGKGGRTIGGNLLQLGGLAAIGGLAYKAWSDYQAGRPPLGLGNGSQPQGAPMAPPPATPAFTSNETAQLVLSAMIAAAKADGHIDDKERARITGEIGAIAGDEAKMFLATELAKPLDIDALAARATSPELAMQVYAASLVAIDPDTDVERAYLTALAERLRIDAGLKAHLEAAVADAKSRG
jgi:uncharacterized membrane protein YebE (DUF533 family)